MVLIRQKKLAPGCLISLRNINAACLSGHTERLENRKRRDPQHDSKERIHSEALLCTHRCYKQGRFPADTQRCHHGRATSAMRRRLPTRHVRFSFLMRRLLSPGREGEREVPIDDFFQGPNKVALEKGRDRKRFSSCLPSGRTPVPPISNTRGGRRWTSPCWGLPHGSP